MSGATTRVIAGVLVLLGLAADARAQGAEPEAGTGSGSGSGSGTGTGTGSGSGSGRPVMDALAAERSSPLSPLAIGGGESLTLTEVLRSVEAHHPAIDAQRARVRAAEGAHLAAEGGFDPALTARGSIAPMGYYNYGRFDALLTQPTPLWGATFFAGWRIGRGFDVDGYGAEVPIYYGYDETLDGGELRVGVTVPLWQGGPTDARRAALARTELGVEEREQELAARLLRVRLGATEAYVRWVAAGQRALVADELLRLAEARDAQISSRVAAGAIPAIEHLENRRAILERRQALITARRALERAAISLSLYLRDDHGRPLVVPPVRVPVPSVARDDAGEPLEDATARALARRPELARLRAVRDQAEVALELAENQLAPRIDVTVQTSIDVGSSADEATRSQLSPPVGEGMLTFSLPLLLREARGRTETARAELAAIDAETELASDQIRIEVADALSALEAARRQVALARESADVASAVAAAERLRFESGATTLLVVNLREAAAAQANVALVDAFAELSLAGAALEAATGGE